MLLGALIDAGAPEEGIRAALDALPVPGWELDVSTVMRGGLRATRAEVVCHPGDAIARSYAAVAALLERASLPSGIRRRATAAFDLLATSEARIHDVEPRDVVFHELGALDTIVDVVGACAAVEHFQPEQVITSPIPTGSGSTRGVHGTIPLPAPAVAEILLGRGAILFGRGDKELVTPTGAALLAVFTTEFGDMPPMRLLATGYGAGAMDLEDPNVLRVLVGAPAQSDIRRRQAVLLEANVDDMSPELVPHLIGSLMDAGAQDAWVTPIVMKKGRPGLTLSVLAAPGQADHMTQLLYNEATTLGVRFSPVTKEELDRRLVEVTVAGHAVRVKLGLKAGRVVNASPEHDDALAAARAAGMPLKTVYAAALRAVENDDYFR
jgi:uncharacterized protein (TIGR00299 family) protein